MLTRWCLDSNVKSLSCLVQNCGLVIQPGSVEKLSETLRQLKLREMKLDLRGWRISDDDLMDLCDGIAEIKSLRKIDLRFSGKELITLFGISYVYAMLPKIKGLESLKIEHRGFSLSKLLWKKFYDYLGTLDLKRVSLKFKNCIGISEFGIKEMADMLNNLKKLEYFTLKAGPCDQIPDEVLFSLKEVLVKKSELKRLKIKLTQLKKLSHDQLNILKGELENNPVDSSIYLSN